MSIFIIKVIAYISMFLDHIKYAIPETQNFITIFLGRIAFPLFAFLLTEGYVHTKNLRKYYIRLTIFALVSQLPFMLFLSIFSENIFKLNVLFTLLLGLMAINLYDKFESKNMKLVGIAGFIIFAYLGCILKVDYSWYGVLLVILLYMFKKKKILLTISVLILNIIYMLNKYVGWNINLIEINHYILFICMNIPLIFILLYDGKQGKKINYIFYYLIYPIHFIILYCTYLIR